MGHAEKIYLLGTSKKVKTKCIASLIDLYHLKHSELEKDLHKCKSRGEDNVEDDSGHGAAFTAQGASASQVAAASFLDTMLRLPGHGWMRTVCQHIALHSLITFSSREHAWLKFKDLCAKNILPSTRHVSFLAAKHTATIHGGVAVP